MIRVADHAHLTAQPARPLIFPARPRLAILDRPRSKPRMRSARRRRPRAPRPPGHRDGGAGAPGRPPCTSCRGAPGRRTAPPATRAPTAAPRSPGRTRGTAAAPGRASRCPARSCDQPARDGQGRVEPFGVVGRQEQDAALARADAVQGVEQAAQGDPRLLGRRPLGLEHAVDVLDQQQGGRRQGIDQAPQRVVRQEPVAQAEHGHRQVQLARRGQHQRRLAVSRAARAAGSPGDRGRPRSTYHDREP